MTRLENNRIYCKLERDSFSVVREKIFDLENETYYLMIAGGLLATPNGVSSHVIGGNHAISGRRFDVSEPGEVLVGPLSALLLAHGSLMIVAWIGLTSIGVFMARYFKTSWNDRKIFGKDAWFIGNVL